MPTAQAHIDRAGGDGREEILPCLDEILANPEPDGQRILRLREEPLIYVYLCGIYHILFDVQRGPTPDVRLRVRAVDAVV
ncbi:MAG: hypothetical protein OXL97_12525 [Chloroflexota bacterium]|nr:hypothetical protein [Chloroflexota bacterium]MDE2883748.1 hypothetical protein [Chloroflexota bacterium]